MSSVIKGSLTASGGVEDAKSGADFEPMAVETETENNGQYDENNSWSSKKWFGGGSYRLPRRYKLVTEENALRASINTLRFSILAAAINTKLLNPNYAIMASGLHPESFPNTDPFNFNSATYFIPMMSLLGVAISSIFVGQISDRVGRKSVLLVLSIVSGFGSIAKYFARETFWGFCIAQLAFGFFLGNLPVGMAYIGDVFISKKQKERELGNLVGCYVCGNAGGGIIAILMEPSGLFAPLWVGAGISWLASITTAWWLIEPSDARWNPIGNALVEQQTEEDDDAARPAEINQCCMWNIVGGALADNIGSTGLFPLCLSPLALETFTFDFVVNMEEPIMSITGYKWLSVCVAFMVVPSTMVTPFIFKRRGVAGTCVLGNVWTGILTMALLFIANIEPPTTATFAGFVTVMYTGFPVTVFSQLTTGPMLDIIAPVDKIGFVQGLNNSAMNFGMAFAPWLLGLLADATTTDTAIWTGIGISFAAGLINTPLMFRKQFGKPEEKPPPAKRLLPGEDKEVVEKALKGDFVPPDLLFEANRQRALKKQSVIVPRVKPYDEEKDSLGVLFSTAEANFRFRGENQDRALAKIATSDREKDLPEVCELLNAAIYSDPEVANEADRDLGQWIADYLKNNGYNPHMNSLLVKQMVLSAFPSILQGEEYTPENVEEALIRSRQVMNQYLSLHEKEKYALSKVLSTNAGQNFFS